MGERRIKEERRSNLEETERGKFLMVYVKSIRPPRFMPFLFCLTTCVMSECENIKMNWCLNNKIKKIIKTKGHTGTCPSIPTDLH